MGKRGPKPKPTNLRVLHGDRRDRINTAEPQPPAQAPAKPDLSPDAGKVWDRLAPDLHKRGLLFDWDAEAFAIYCETVASWWQAKKLCEVGMLVRGQKGNLVKNPAWVQMVQAATLVRQYAQEFGLTPAGRTGLKVGDSGHGDAELEALLS